MSEPDNTGQFPPYFRYGFMPVGQQQQQQTSFPPMSLSPTPYGPLFFVPPSGGGGQSMNLPPRPSSAMDGTHVPHPMMMPMGFFQHMPQGSAGSPMYTPPMFYNWQQAAAAAAGGYPMFPYPYAAAGGGSSQGTPSVRESDYSDATPLPPDVVSSKLVGTNRKKNGRFSKRMKKPMAEPDVISKAPSLEPLYMNQKEFPEISEPTYANDNQEQRSRFPRGASLPPMFCDEIKSRNPIPPPRSRRGSTWSLNKSSTQSIHLAGLSDRLATFKSAIDALKSDLTTGQEPQSSAPREDPKRPPRRSDRFKKKSFLGTATLPRNFRTQDHLGIISEDLAAISEVTNADDSSPKIPLPGGELEEPSPTFPDSTLILGAPVVPMPGGGNSPSSSSSLASLSVKREQFAAGIAHTSNPSTPSPMPSPRIPMPGRPFDVEIIITPKKQLARPPSSTAEAYNFKDTLAISNDDAAEERSRVNTPIILTNPDANCSVTRGTGVVVNAMPEASTETTKNEDSDLDGHIYEDVDFVLRTPPETVKKAILKINVNAPVACDGITMEVRDETPPSVKGAAGAELGDPDYDDVEQNVPVPKVPEEDSSTEYEEMTEDKTSNLETTHDKTSEAPEVDQSRTGSSNSIDRTRNEILEGIKSLDQTIENLKIGMIKVYEDVYASTRPIYAVPNKGRQQLDLVLAEPVQIGNGVNYKEEEEGDNVVLGFQDQMNKEFRKSFFGINELVDDEADTNQQEQASNAVLDGPDDNYNWEDITLDTSSISATLVMQEKLKSLKLDLLSSLFQGLYPSQRDCLLVNRFISCPVSLEEKYSMMRLGDILSKNKRSGVGLDTLVEAVGQLAKIGQELLRQEVDRDPVWRVIKVAKEITVSKGIAERAPWEKIQGGTEILESLGYTEYTGFALQYPRSVLPEFFSDHIGNLTVELVLAAAEISTLIVHVPPSLEALLVLQESEAFPGNDPEVYYPEIPVLQEIESCPVEEEKLPSMRRYQNCDDQASSGFGRMPFATCEVSSSELESKVHQVRIRFPCSLSLSASVSTDSKQKDSS